MNAYGMELYAQIRPEQRREETDIRRLLRAARPESTGGSWRRRWLRLGGSRPSARLAEAS
jgi:hypothetical protein